MTSRETRNRPLALTLVRSTRSPDERVSATSGVLVPDCEDAIRATRLRRAHAMARALAFVRINPQQRARSSTHR
jgi:hypothetical protein